MPISKQELIRLSSVTTYAKGEVYHRQKRVKVILDENGLVLAIVRGSGGKGYDVSIMLTEDGKDLRAWDCNCPALEQYGGICKHIIATVLEMKSLHGLGGAAHKPHSDRSALLLLSRYAQSLADEAQNRQEGQARFEAVLEWMGDSGVSLSFRAGESRMYVIPDLSQFEARFRNRETYAYGKSFTLWHSLSSFCEESRPLLDFFRKRYDPYDNFRNGAIGYGYIAQKRNMVLNRAMADEFFALMEGKTLTVRDANRRETSVPVVREDFRPQLSVQKTKGGAVLALQNPCRIIHGEGRDYLYDVDRRLFVCGQEFTAACGGLLDAFQQSGQRLFFAESDIAILFSTVIPRVEAYVDLKGAEDFDSYKPLPLVSKIYFDAPGPDSVTASMRFHYGDTSFPAFGEKRIAQSQDLVAEIVAENLLIQYCGKRLDEAGALHIENDPDAVYRLIAQGLEELSAVAEIYSTDSFGKVRIRPPVSATVGVRVDAGLLQMDFDLEGLDLSELPAILASYRSAKKYHRLRDGSFLTLEENALSGLSELAEGLDLSDKQLAAGHAQLVASRALFLDAICKKSEDLRVDRDKEFKRILRDMREVENADFEVPKSLRKTLRNYQKTGFRWLKTITAYGFGGILADDMGLGKTLQILALLQSQREEVGRQNGASKAAESLPSIVVCPASLALNWESEAQKFTPDLRVCVIAGSASERAALIRDASGYDLLITSYDYLKRDIQLYEAFRFEFVIIDEAQYIKNQSTQNAKSVKALQGKTRFALTGTPVENSLAELWSIFDFLMPGYLFNYNRFKKKYEEPIVKNGAVDASERLRALVGPFLLRRLKKDVLRELPPKTESILRASMEDKQKQVYLSQLALVKGELAEKLGLGVGQDKMMILAALTKMRQICCDPSLLYENYDGASVKLESCMELVDSCIESGRRMLLFSQFTSMLDIIEQRLHQKGVATMRIDGATKTSKRLELVNVFNTGDTPVFLISLKAGGTGLNLTGADVVIHYDPWWNLSAQNQATDRAHRIGQKNSVQVYKLIVKDTIEERILKMQEQKADLANAVIEDHGSPFEKLNRDELLALFDEKALA